MLESNPGIWWRDDDFTGYVSSFQALERVADRLHMRPLVSAIPANIAPSFERKDEKFRFAVHGWRHVNHGCKPGKKSEYGFMRPVEGVEEELRLARERAREHLGDCLENWFVPPYNRITEEHFSAFLNAGYEGLSTSGLESYWMKHFHGLKLPFVTVSVWDGVNRRVKEAEVVIKDLESRISGRSGVGPFGLMTHHKIFDADDWRRFEETVAKLSERGWNLHDCDAGFCKNFPVAPQVTPAV